MWFDLFKLSAKAKLRDIRHIFSVNIFKVVNAMDHAVTSTHPKLRYVLGLDHQLIWRTLSFLPSEIQDFFFGLMLPKPKGIAGRGT